jgi:hypothetical protein
MQCTQRGATTDTKAAPGVVAGTWAWSSRIERPAQWEGALYRQMYRYVRGKIEAGIYAVGDQLPKPEQLEWHFGADLE